MTVRFIRTLAEMRPVLKNPGATGPDPVYTVYNNLDNSWVNKTVLAPGTYDGEFTKTFGHYHADNKDETYRIDSGQGLLLMENETEFLIVSAKAGDKVLIPRTYGHCWVNVGSEPLVSYDDHEKPQDDYEEIKQKHGLSYYIISDNGQPKAVPNPNYSTHPEPKWLTASDFN